MKRALVTAGVAAAALALLSAPSARADGDPASDYLYAYKVFLPYDAKFAKPDAARFTALVSATNKAGFKIRVAVIWSSYDMGSVTVLYGKPRTYAKFLGLELSFIYKQRLLIVEPAGFGFNWPKHSTTAEYALLSKIPIKPGPAGLLAAAQAAVTKLAAAGGVTVSPQQAATTTGGGHANTYDREVILAAVLGALALAAAARYLVRRRRSP